MTELLYRTKLIFDQRRFTFVTELSIKIMDMVSTGMCIKGGSIVVHLVKALVEFML